MAQDSRPSVFLSDHAVLQRDTPLRLAGQAAPGAAIAVTLDRQPAVLALASTTDGAWELVLPPQPAGGPHTLALRTDDTTRVFTDLLFGEVWLAAGQSNMEWELAKSHGGAEAAAAAHDPSLRLLRVPRHAAGHPAAALPADTAWTPCTPETAAAFSAVAYHFARLRRATRADIPIGLIQTAWGGTPIAAWSAPDPATCDELARLLADPAAQAAEDAAWCAARDAALADPTEFDQGWAAPAHDDHDWLPCPVPGNFEETIGDHDGAVWYRRTIEIPRAWADRELELHLGVIDDLDHTYWDGHLVGRTGTDTPEYYKTPRRYRIPPALALPGRRQLAVRVFDEFLAGGFVGDATDLWLAPVGAPASAQLPLPGLWRVRAGLALTSRRMLPGMPHMLPGVLFNGMIAPLLGTPLAGILWYQGENDVGHAQAYARRFPALITDWRARWGLPLLPFLFVQLANHGRPRATPVGSALAELRAAQASALALPATGMATAIDLGEADDIHPREKAEVGRRLHLAALSVFSANNTLRYGGPLAARVTHPRPDLLRVEFEHLVPPLRTSVGAAPRGFTVCAADGSHHLPVETRLKDDNVLLLGPWESLPAPLEVRHAWACNPECNLYDARNRPSLSARIRPPEKRRARFENPNPN